ncbi:HNH endonuclease [Escherichia coli]
MNNEIKFNHIKRLWFLKDCVVFSRATGKPIAFSSKGKDGRRFTAIRINGKFYSINIHKAVFMLHHNRPIAEGKEIHHKDGNYENNAPENLIELTSKQHKRIHAYQCDDPMRGIRLDQGAWKFKWVEDNGSQHYRSFHGIDEAIKFRAEIEEPRRQELRALGLNCKRVSSGEKSRRIVRNKIYFSHTTTIL